MHTGSNAKPNAWALFTARSRMHLEASMAPETQNSEHDDRAADRQRAWTAALKVGYGPLIAEQLPTRFRALLAKLDGADLPDLEQPRRQQFS